ncbi:MAG TPA: cytochrome c oxidase subunit I, partial [Algoriphagus sp.]|nr:cytochrome c oxidase subunit I [Algoriphagus sp.]
MATASVATHDTAHDHHDHEHHDNFVTKYIFSTDHKMIGKQFLVTGIFWAIIGGFLSILFRLQLGFPEMNLEFLRPLLGGWIDESGALDPTFYLALVTMHGTIMVFFV